MTINDESDLNTESSVMSKYYISAEELLQDSFLLAKKVFDFGYRPDHIIGIWRGGGPIAIAIHEYFDYMGVESQHHPVKISSYSDLGQQKNYILIKGLSSLIDSIKSYEKVLIVDDVLDTGRSLDALLTELGNKNIDLQPQRCKIACPWYKPTRNLTSIQPDFYLRTTHDWLVFPHELKGLSAKEISLNKTSISKIITQK